MRTASTKRRANSSAQEIAGDVGVLLCVAGLGPSAILSNRESIRVYLPHRLKEILETTETSVLKGIARSYAKGRVKPGAPATQENQALVSSENTSPAITNLVSNLQVSHHQGGEVFLTGDVYELAVEDLQMIATMPNQISGKIRLTETYNPYTPSFITIPVSNELVISLSSAAQRLSDQSSLHDAFTCGISDTKRA
ncbi:hypothetical protein LOZ57_000927 [Ophidiomyces ophidiicola]|uniref:uncharacterized protein n=1 Tax=Ophidiomyces ophidiicola TaxID=1387563 RepID=UPI0020C1E70E|nr:uncharacterized protein LOZ57_000927 [Ophidiomyces ophidiicola]KAI1952844.1 hypothetical protein LOZ57_000927 [Ophidiomyces ophidiicola]KAI2062048.1 hypothetical protein LOZ43_000797 [Ophidiomyces ophidiicola]